MGSSFDPERLAKAQSLRFGERRKPSVFFRAHVLDGIFHRVLPMAEWMFKAVGIYQRGVRNSLALGVTEMTLAFPNLPEAFDGYRLLHASDMHVGNLPGMMEVLEETVRPLDADLLVLTGDYACHWKKTCEGVVDGVARLAGAAAARDGALCVFGNHDPLELANPIAELGVRVLLNETATFRRGDDAIHLTGLDDVHFFVSDETERAMAESPDGFKIALVHSPEYAEQAADAGCALYLAGHTHGGQIRLPGGKAPFTALKRNKDLASGAWRLGAMKGYTSRGIGASRLPLRFNCPPEVGLITLVRGRD